MNIAPMPNTQQQGLNNSIFINSASEYHKINLDSILYIKGYGDYMQFNLADKNFLVHITMSKLESCLPSSTFFRVHRSYIIRVDKIDKLNTNSVMIKGNEIPISKKKKYQLLELLPKIE